MRTITIPWPDPAEVVGRDAVVPVLVDWFPRLTDDQIVANAVALIDGKPQPFPNPNLLQIHLTR